MPDWSHHYRIAPNVLETTGCTPLVRLNRVTQGVRATICAKLEFFGPSGSVKDRIVPLMVQRAEARGELRPGMTIIEATTGNTGIATATTGAVLGYPVIIVMPEGVSEERKRTIRAYGAELVLTPGGPSDVHLVVAKVQELKAQTPGRLWEVGQFVNHDNAAAHEATTGPEIWEQTEGQIDVFVAAHGTGGTVTGAARFLKRQNPAVKVFAAEPAECPILSGGSCGVHRIEGIADGFVPAVLDIDLLDGIITISSEEAIAMARRLAREEGIFCGASSGCNVAATLRVACRYPEARLIVTMIDDNGLRYLSTELCDERPPREVPRLEHPLPPEVKARLAAKSWVVLR